MNGIPADTTPDAARKQFEILRKLDTATRAEMMFQLSDNLRSIVEAGTRLRHPEYDEQKVQREVLRLMVGEALFRQVYPAFGR